MLKTEGTSIVRKITWEERANFPPCPDTYQIFMAKDGAYVMVSGEIVGAVEAEQALSMMASHEELGKDMLFLVRVTRQPIAANFSPLLLSSPNTKQN